MGEQIEETELSIFIRSAIDDIQKGFKGSQYKVPREIAFDVSVTKSKKADRTVRIFVVEAGGKYEKHTVQRLAFSSGLINHGPIYRVRHASEALQAAEVLKRQAQEED